MNDKTVLLVEDNEDDIELTLLAFRKNNFDINFAIVRDGSEALDYLLGKNADALITHINKPVLIFLDLNLPKIDGLEVLKQLRSNESTRIIPVVVLSTSKDKKDIMRSFINGANSYIIKPVDFSEFLDVVKYLGHYWLFLNELPY